MFNSITMEEKVAIRHCFMRERIRSGRVGIDGVAVADDCADCVATADDCDGITN